MTEIKLKTRVQEIYYQDDTELKLVYATSDKKISHDEAKSILDNMGLPHTQILKIKYANVTVTIGYDTFKENLNKEEK